MSVFRLRLGGGSMDLWSSSFLLVESLVGDSSLLETSFALDDGPKEITDANTEHNHAYAKRKEEFIAASSLPTHIFLDGEDTAVACEHSIKLWSV